MNDVDVQWASSDRQAASRAKFVAVKSVTHRGQKIAAGLTRVAEDHPWLAELRDTFAAVESSAGTAAIRARASDGTSTATTPLWFTRRRPR